MSTPRLAASTTQIAVVLAQVGVVALLALAWSLDMGPVAPGQVDWAFVGLLLGTPALLVAASVLGAAVLARQSPGRSVVRALALLSTGRDQSARPSGGGAGRAARHRRRGDRADRVRGLGGW